MLIEILWQNFGDRFRVEITLKFYLLFMGSTILWKRPPDKMVQLIQCCLYLHCKFLKSSITLSKLYIVPLQVDAKSLKGTIVELGFKEHNIIFKEQYLGPIYMHPTWRLSNARNMHQFCGQSFYFLDVFSVNYDPRVVIWAIF